MRASKREAASGATRDDFDDFDDVAESTDKHN